MAVLSSCSLLAVLAAVPFQDTGATVGRVFHVGEEASWVFEVDGKRVGHHTSRFDGRVSWPGLEVYHFQGSLLLDVPQLGDVQLRSSADLWTDELGHPQRFVQQVLLGESYSRVELEVAGPSSKAVVVQGPARREIPLAVEPEAYLLANNFVSHIEILLALRSQDVEQPFRLFSANALQGLAYTLKLDAGAESDVPLFRDSLGEELLFDERLLEVRIPAQKTVIRRVEERFEPITIEPPEVRAASAEFDSQEVRITRGAEVLAGVVTKPKGAPGRLAAVFFISGSGPEDRNGFSSGVDLGTWEILDRLTRAGFLVLRVDDRGAGESSPLPPGTTFPDLVADARACVEFLIAREDVDPARVALIGHSEGGVTAPLLAAERPTLAAIVLMAAPGRPVLEIIADQNRRALEEQKLAPEEIERQLQGVIAFLKRLAGDEPIDPAGLSAEERVAVAMRPWLQSHALQDPLANIRRVRCPILLVQGAKDFQVSLERDAKALEAALVEAGHPDHELRAFPDLDHLFKRVPGERSELSDYWKNRPVDTEFLDVLCAWLEARLKPRDH